MFRRHILGFAGGPSAAVSGVCLRATDGPGGGGAPAGGAAVADHPAGDPGGRADGGADPGADPGAGDPHAAADPGDFDDDVDDGVIDTLPETTLRTQHRRLQRQRAKLRPLTDRLRGTNGQFMSPQELDSVLENHRQFGPIDAVLRRSPEAVQMLMREQARLDALDRGERVPAAGTEPEETPFNEEEWPFEVETAQGRYLLQMARDLHAMKGENKRLKGELTGVQSGFRSHARSTAEQTWKSATLAAAKEIDDPNARRWFVNLISREFDHLEKSGRLGSVDVNKLIAGELRDIRAGRAGRSRQTITRQSQTVANNGKLPATPGPGKTTPASDGKPGGGRETMADASRGFLKKYRG